MQGGTPKAVAAILRVRLEYLSCQQMVNANLWGLFEKSNDQLAMHRPLHAALREVLESINDHPLNLYIRNRRQDPPWINAASQCDRIRSFQKQKKCYHNASKGRAASQAGCVQANTLHVPTLFERIPMVSFDIPDASYSKRIKRHVVSGPLIGSCSLISQVYLAVAH